ncbi:inorganic diphosphatase [Streptomyces sp. NPDC003328]|uniref:inorganic diphosphatase n=1 Tax=Streptomyces lannensis TaxID=766498 RepID=A0ABP7L6E2_9ACTN|nr:inorganic diphosphatase [Streptomyces sp. WAC07094]
MPKIAITVDATVASSIRCDEEIAGPSAYLEPEAHGTAGWPVGHGSVVNTLGDDGRPLEALVLMCEPALPGDALQARPVATLHLSTPGRAVNEVLCVAEAPCFGDLADSRDLPRWHAEPGAWAEALARLTPGRTYRVAGCGPARETEELLSAARQCYLRLTGCLE